MTANNMSQLPHEKGFHISWDQIHRDSRALAWRLDGMGPDDGGWRAVVAISRGGCMPARVICDYLDVFDLDVIKIEHYHGVHKAETALLKYPLSAEISGRRVLLIDDVSDTGDSFEIGMRHFYAEWSRRMGRKASDPFGKDKPVAA